MKERIASVSARTYTSRNGCHYTDQLPRSWFAAE